MGKTVKHCSTCEENFADRFSFCPVCGTILQNTEVGGEKAFAAPKPPELIAAAPREETVATAAAAIPAAASDGVNFVRRESAGTNGASGFHQNEPKSFNADGATEKAVVTPVKNKPHDNGTFHLTILEAPRGRTNTLSAGALIGFVVVFTALTGFWIWGLFQTNLNIEAVGAEDFLGAVYASNEATPVEEKEIVRKDTDKGGGGGGGGQQSKTEASYGKEPQMMRVPTDVKPDVNTYKNDRFELKQPIAVKGPENQPVDKRDLPYGIESSKNLDPSGGTGRDGGIGTGVNGGVGSGINSGLGSGMNGGKGAGKNGGIGDHDGVGQNGDILPELAKEKPKPAVTEPLSIISKPRANYTEDARKQNIQGTVVLKVTFSASGAITNISALKGLSGGLTEQAIAAARQIRFTPKKINGQAVSVTKSVEFAFNMY